MRWARVGGLLVALLLVGCTADPTPRPAAPTSTLAVPVMPSLTPIERSPGAYLTVQPVWSIEDYRRIQDEVPAEHLQAFLHDHLRDLAERIAAAARANGYPDAEVAMIWPSPHCASDGGCPSYDPTFWQVLLAGPFADAPPHFTDLGVDLSRTEVVAIGTFREQALAREFHTPFVGDGVAVVSADEEDREQHRYTPFVQAVWFG